MDYLNDKIRHFATWLKANKLFINVKKTKITIFRPKQKKLLVRSPLKVDNAIIEEVLTHQIFRCLHRPASCVENAYLLHLYKNF